MDKQVSHIHWALNFCPALLEQGIISYDCCNREMLMYEHLPEGLPGKTGRKLELCGREVRFSALTT